MIRCAGMRSESAPAIGATIIGIAVHGRMRRPEPSGEYPCTVWKNCASKKIDPNMPKLISIDAMFASVKVRLRKKRMGSIGCSARSSQATNAARTTRLRRARRRSRSRPSRRSCRGRGPRRSRRDRRWRARGRAGRPCRTGPCVSSSRSSASGISTRPSGTLSQKIQCQEMPLTTAPPTSGPNATASPLMPPHAPRKTPRRFSGTPAERIVSVSGRTIAPPRPCTARAASSAPIDGASAAAAEASGEDAEPDREHQPAPEAVAERRAGQEQDGEDERVRVDGPLEPAEARMQVLADHRDRRRHDEVVERDHEEREPR